MGSECIMINITKRIFGWKKIKFPILYILGNTSLTRDIKRLNEFVKASREKIWMDRKTGCYH